MHASKDLHITRTWLGGRNSELRGRIEAKGEKKKMSDLL